MTDEGKRLAYILDSSALLAAVMGEPGADRVLEIIDQSAISAVNLLDVFGKLIQKGIPAERVRERLEGFARRDGGTSPPHSRSRRPGEGAAITWISSGRNP